MRAVPRIKTRGQRFETLAPVLFLTCFLLLGVADASAHRLGKGEARTAAESKALDFELSRSWLNYFDVNQCTRKAQLRVDCVAVVSGDTETKSSSCRLLIAVRAVHRRYYWVEVAKIAGSHCRSLQIPVLTYADARKAIQAEADRFAGQTTLVTSLSRQDAQTYSGRAEWKRVNPTGCKGCGYDPGTSKFFDTPATESCSAELKARRLGDDTIRVVVEGSACH